MPETVPDLPERPDRDGGGTAAFLRRLPPSASRVDQRQLPSAFYAHAARGQESAGIGRVVSTRRQDSWHKDMGLVSQRVSIKETVLPRRTARRPRADRYTTAISPTGSKQGSAMPSPWC